MGRAFGFSAQVKSRARFRQMGKCACCGESLNDVEEHAHHVVPNQSGNATNPRHQWLATSENCVVLCAMCHGRVHQGHRYRYGAVAPPSYYPYSHGGNPALHQTWSRDLTNRTQTIWP